MLEKLDVTFMIRSKALFPAGWTETLLSATGGEEALAQCIVVADN